MKERIGFVGLGMMGHGIASNILKNEYPLTGLVHRNRAPLEDLLKQGASEAFSISDLVEESDIVFFCVTGAQEVETLVYGENGVLDNCKAGFILVDCSTSNPG